MLLVAKVIETAHALPTMPNLGTSAYSRPTPTTNLKISKVNLVLESSMAVYKNEKGTMMT